MNTKVPQLGLGTVQYFNLWTDLVFYPIHSSRDDLNDNSDTFNFHLKKENNEHLNPNENNPQTSRFDIGHI